MLGLKGLIPIGLIVILLLGCTLDATPMPDAATLQVDLISTEVVEASPEVSPLWTDEIATMSGICFESALDAAGQVFVIGNDEQLIRFYDLADNSRLCRNPVKRNSFDFGNGRILAGLWSEGRGCNAHHDLLSFEINDHTRTLVIHLRFITDGDCDYELVRPFWIGLNGVSDYEILIEVE